VPLTDAQEAAESTPTATNTNTKCADGWFLCSGGKNAGGCCPSGYACGMASCTLVAPTATQTVAKEAPEGNAAAAGMRMRPESLVFMALSMAFGWAVVFL
jgi:progranulin